MAVKTLFALLVSLLLTMSLCLNIAFLIPMPRDVYLFVGFVGGFLTWGGFISWVYCQSSIKSTLKTALPVFVVSAVINITFYTGVLA